MIENRRFFRDCLQGDFGKKRKCTGPAMILSTASPTTELDTL